MMEGFLIIGVGVAIVFLFIALSLAAYGIYRKIRNSKIVNIRFRHSLQEHLPQERPPP